jgi:hypothetical protein
MYEKIDDEKTSLYRMKIKCSTKEDIQAVIEASIYLFESYKNNIYKTEIVDNILFVYITDSNIQAYLSTNYNKLQKGNLYLTIKFIYADTLMLSECISRREIEMVVETNQKSIHKLNTCKLVDRIEYKLAENGYWSIYVYLFDFIVFPETLYCWEHNKSIYPLWCKVKFIQIPYTTFNMSTNTINKDVYNCYDPVSILLQKMEHASFTDKIIRWFKLFISKK